MNVAYNMDCLAAMREMPDNAFDLAVVDPPYGGGFTEGGGCQGWFAKYHQESERERAVDHLHSSCRQRERERQALEQIRPALRQIQDTTLSDFANRTGTISRRENWPSKNQKNYIVGCRAETRIF